MLHPYSWTQLWVLVAFALPCCQGAVTLHLQRLHLSFWLIPGESVFLERWAAAGLFMLLTRSNAVISHQVANYGMGGQYEPHFDFSRVRPNRRYPAPIGL